MTCPRTGCWSWMNKWRKFEPKKGAPPPNARQRVLAEWRGMDLYPLEKALKPAARSSAVVMPQVLARLNLDLRRSETEILKAWNHLLDPNITAHARPTGWRRGTLFVTVDNSVWLHEIVRYRQREILNRLQNCFGRDLIDRISFRVG